MQTERKKTQEAHTLKNTKFETVIDKQRVTKLFDIKHKIPLSLFEVGHL